MLYVDTSAFVPIFAREDRSEAIVGVLGARPDDIAISSWVLTETVSALAQKVRMRAMTSVQAQHTQAMINRVRATHYVCEAVLDEDFEIAAMMIPRARGALRAGDALHLAICKRLGADLLTLDREMKAAADGFAMPVAEI